VIDPTDAKAGADVIIDGVGYAATRSDASALVRPGGVIAHIGLGEAEGGLDIRRMTLQEITFIGTYTYTADDCKPLSISKKIVDDLVANDVSFVTTVPCKQLAGVIDEVENRKEIFHIPSNKEDEGMGLCAGAFMGGKRPAIIMQNTARYRCDNQHAGDVDPILPDAIADADFLSR